MKRPALFALGPVAAAIVIAGCGGGGTSSSSSAAAPNSPSATKAAGPQVALGHSNVGSFLVDGKGRTLYLFEADKSTMSSCYSACASVWPPLTTTGSATAGASVKASDLGTTKRTDGITEVTYNGHPLYYYAGDGKPGQTAGQGLNQFGAKWYVVSRAGTKVDNDEH